jgi:hypothetical protein
MFIFADCTREKIKFTGWLLDFTRVKQIEKPVFSRATMHLSSSQKSQMHVLYPIFLHKSIVKWFLACSVSCC